VTISKLCDRAASGLFLLVLLLVGPTSQAGIISNVIETNLGTDTPAIIATDFGEDVLAFSDRTHQHNGAAFDDTGTLTTPTGPNIVGLPSYLVGADYVRFANSAKGNDDYSATVFSNGRAAWYLLVDNRMNGPEDRGTSPNTTDPVLGGTLQWVIDGNWERVNTGLSPNGQADYTGIDEGGEAVGSGQGLDQFFSVYRFPLMIDVVTVRNPASTFTHTNMVTLLAVPEPSTSLLTALALATLAAARRRR